MIATRALLSSVVLVGLSAVLVAQTPALDVKLGLWENTIVTNMGGPPPIDTSKMSPEQPAKMAEAMKAAEKIASASLPAMLMVKECVNEAFETTLSGGIHFERRLFHAMFATEDQKEGMAAFVAKRPARWTGR